MDLLQLGLGRGVAAHGALHDVAEVLDLVSFPLVLGLLGVLGVLGILAAHAGEGVLFALSAVLRDRQLVVVEIVP